MRLTKQHISQDPSASYHVASLVVHCRPENVTRIISNIAAEKGLSVPQHETDGRLIVLLESPDEKHLTEGISFIEHLPGVVSTSLVFHQIDR